MGSTAGAPGRTVNPADNLQNHAYHRSEPKKPQIEELPGGESPVARVPVVDAKVSKKEVKNHGGALLPVALFGNWSLSSKPPHERLMRPEL